MKKNNYKFVKLLLIMLIVVVVSVVGTMNYTINQVEQYRSEKIDCFDCKYWNNNVCIDKDSIYYCCNIDKKECSKNFCGEII